MSAVVSQWQSAAAVVLERCGVALAIGAPDSGKSSFVFWLARQAAVDGRRVWVVDGDVGQSDVGPPTAIGAALIPPDLEVDGFKPACPLAAASLYFVGSTSPRGHLLPMVTGTVRAVADARAAGADLVLVNTTGYVHDLAAVVLKIAKIDAVRPDVVVAFGDPTPLAAILDPYRSSRTPLVVRCAAPAAVRRRSPEEREAARNRNWLHYFEPAQVRSILLGRVGLSGEGRRWAESHDLRGRVLGLYDALGVCRGLGVVARNEGLTWEVLTPFEGEVARIHVGAAQLAP
jgi:polynucleotide 5'-hydroxyl-kinase GRC3/NOL9